MLWEVGHLWSTSPWCGAQSPCCKWLYQRWGIMKHITQRILLPVFCSGHVSPKTPKPGPTNQTLISNQKTRPHPHHLSTVQSFSSTHLSSPTGEVMPPIPPTQSPLATCQLNDPKEKAIHKTPMVHPCSSHTMEHIQPTNFLWPNDGWFFLLLFFLPILWVLLILSCLERSGIKPYSFKWQYKWTQLSILK